MRSRLRPAPATVLAGLALFIALGGTSYAISNRINGASLKDRSVAGTKLKKHTVTGTEVNVSKFPRVPAADQADDATNATNAVHATSATEAGALTGTVQGNQVSGPVGNATTAASAATVDGHAFAQINGSAGSNTPATILDDFGGLTLECTGPSGAAGMVTVAVIPSGPQGGVFGISAIDGTGAGHRDEGPVGGSVGGVPQTTNFTFPISGGGAQMSFSYTSSVGTTTDVVSGTLTMIQNNGCTAFGNADASSVAG